MVVLQQLRRLKAGPERAALRALLSVFRPLMVPFECRITFLLLLCADTRGVLVRFCVRCLSLEKTDVPRLPPPYWHFSKKLPP